MIDLIMKDLETFFREVYPEDFEEKLKSLPPALRCEAEGIIKTLLTCSRIAVEILRVEIELYEELKDLFEGRYPEVVDRLEQVIGLLSKILQIYGGQ